MSEDLNGSEELGVREERGKRRVMVLLRCGIISMTVLTDYDQYTSSQLKIRVYEAYQALQDTLPYS